MACWTPHGFIGETFRLFSRYLPPTPGLQPPVRWGDEAYQRELFGNNAASMTSYPRTAIFRYKSAEENVNFFRTYYGPTLRAFDALPAERSAALNDEITRQAATIAYVDDFRLMMYLMLLAVPMLLLLRSPRRQRAATAAMAVAE